MKRSNLKYIIGSLILALTIQSAIAQPVARIGYFLDNSTHKHLLNPALVPARGYFGYPGVSAINMDFDSNLKLSTFLFPPTTQGDPMLTFLSPDVTSEQFLSQLLPDNYLKMDTRLSLASLGFYAGSTFWTLEVASRIKGNMNMPIGLFDFMKNGMSAEAGNTYNLDNLTVGMNALAEVSLGTSFRITNNFRLGVKVKGLGGLAKMVGGLDEMSIDMRPDAWNVSSKGLIDMYAPNSVEFNTDGDGYIDISGGNPIKYDLETIKQDVTSLKLPGMGYALDAGFSWAPFSFLQLSAGIIDLGQVTWKNTQHQVYKSNGSISFSGLEGLGLETTEIGDQLPDIEGMIMDMAKFKKQTNTETEDLVEELVPTVNAGVELGVLRNKISVGVLYTNHMIKDNNQTELTGMVNLKPGKGLNFAASYNLINRTINTMGFAFGLNLGIANIFIACDNFPLDVTPEFNIEGIPVPLFLPIHSISPNIQAGVSLSLGKMRVKK